MLNDADDGGQFPFVIVQVNVFVPMLRLFTLVDAEPALPSDAVPELTVQSPVPIIGVVADIVPVAEQICWSLPTLAVLGGRLRRMFTSSKTGGQTPFVTVQRRTTFPSLKPETALRLFEASANDPLPETTDQTPFPSDGEAAFSMVLSAQICWSLPALADKGSSKRVMVTWLVFTGQTPLLTVH